MNYKLYWFLCVLGTPLLLISAGGCYGVQTEQSTCSREIIGLCFGYFQHTLQCSGVYTQQMPAMFWVGLAFVSMGLFMSAGRPFPTIWHHVPESRAKLGEHGEYGDGGGARVSETSQEE